MDYFRKIPFQGLAIVASYVSLPLSNHFSPLLEISACPSPLAPLASFRPVSHRHRPLPLPSYSTSVAHGAGLAFPGCGPMRPQGRRGLWDISTIGTDTTVPTVRATGLRHRLRFIVPVPVGSVPTAELTSLSPRSKAAGVARFRRLHLCSVGPLRGHRRSSLRRCSTLSS